MDMYSGLWILEFGPWFFYRKKIPSLSELVTDKLSPIISLLHIRKIIVLNAGNGGPWPRIAQEFSKSLDHGVQIVLTDPNPQDFLEDIWKSRITNEDWRIKLFIWPHRVLNSSSSPNGFRVFVHFQDMFPVSPASAQELIEKAYFDHSGVAIFDIWSPKNNHLCRLLIFVPIWAILFGIRKRPCSAMWHILCIFLPLIPIWLIIEGFLVHFFKRSFSEEIIPISNLQRLFPELTFVHGCCNNGFFPLRYLICYRSELMRGRILDY